MCTSHSLCSPHPTHYYFGHNYKYGFAFVMPRSVSWNKLIFGYNCSSKFDVSLSERFEELMADILPVRPIPGLDSLAIQR